MIMLYTLKKTDPERRFLPFQEVKLGESGENCITSKLYQGDLFQKYPTDEKSVYRKVPPYRFLPICVLLAAEVEENRDK